MVAGVPDKVAWKEDMGYGMRVEGRFSSSAVITFLPYMLQWPYKLSKKYHFCVTRSRSYSVSTALCCPCSKSLLPYLTLAAKIEAAKLGEDTKTTPGRLTIAIPCPSLDHPLGTEGDRYCCPTIVRIGITITVTYGTVPQ